MTTEALAAAKTSHVINLDEYRKSPLKDRKAGFNGMPNIITDNHNLSTLEYGILALILGAIGNRTYLKRTKAWFCVKARKSYPTICRGLAGLEKKQWISTAGRGDDFKIYPSELCYIDDPDELIEAIKSAQETDTRVLYNDNKTLKNENPTIICLKKELRKIPDEPLKKPPEQLPEKIAPKVSSIQATPVPIFKSETTKKLGDFAESITKSCAHIVKMPGEKTFNPAIFIFKTLKDHVHPRVIDESLSFVATFKSLDEIDPYAVVRNRSKLKTQKYNARDAEIESDKRKLESIENGKIVFVMKGI